MDSDGSLDIGEAEPAWAKTVRARWEVPELVAVGAVVASVGIFIGSALAGIYAAVRSPFGTGIGISFGTEWVSFTVPLTLLATLAAWSFRSGKWTMTAGGAAATHWRRMRPCLVAVALLSVFTVGAGLARLAYTLAVFSTRSTDRVANLALQIGFCMLAVVSGVTLWLAARRLLRPADPETPPESPVSV
jgi:hypothetical protein